MKKKLLALAVAGALAAPLAAMADVTIYGAADVSFDMVNSGSGTTAPNGTVAMPGVSYNAHQVSSNASRIGFKGSEDLGGGTSAVWQIETHVNIDNSTSAAAPTNGFGTRNTFAGLSGENWGTLILGRHDTPYKLSTRGLDLFADTIADNRSLMGGGLGGIVLGSGAAASFDGRQGDVVAFISPAMSGFTAAVAYVAGAETPFAAVPANTKGSAWSLAGMYNAGPLNGALAYEVHDLGTAGSGTLGALPATVVTGQKESAWKLGVGYTMDQFTANFAYEKTSDNFGGAPGTSTAGLGTVGGSVFGHSAWYLAGKFNVSASDAVKLAYTHSGDLDFANVAGGVNTVGKLNTSASQISLGYDHSMSKRTTVYALYTKLSNNAGNIYPLMPGNGATSAGIAAGGCNADPSAWSLGMKHTF